MQQRRMKQVLFRVVRPWKITWVILRSGCVESTLSPFLNNEKSGQSLGFPVIVANTGFPLGLRPMGETFELKRQKSLILSLKPLRRGVKWCFSDYLDQMLLFQPCLKSWKWLFEKIIWNFLGNLMGGDWGRKLLVGGESPPSPPIFHLRGNPE